MKQSSRISVLARSSHIVGTTITIGWGQFLVVPLTQLQTAASPNANTTRTCPLQLFDDYPRQAIKWRNREGGKERGGRQGRARNHPREKSVVTPTYLRGGPGGGYKVHAPRRRRRLSTLRGPRRRIPGRRGRGGGGRLAALWGKRARDFGGSEGRREAHLSPGRRGRIVGGIRIHVRGRNFRIRGGEEISDVTG